MTNLKGVAHSGKPTENYHSTLQLPSVLRSFFGTFQLIVLVLQLIDKRTLNIHQVAKNMTLY